MICVSMVRSQELKVYKIAVQVPTYNDDMPEGCRIVDAGAVPSLMSKLVLALGGSQAYTVADGDHSVRGGPAHIPLAAGEPGDPTAEYFGSESDDTINPGTKTK